MRTVRTSVVAFAAVAFLFGCVVNNNPPPVTPADIPPASDAGSAQVPDATVAASDASASSSSGTSGTSGAAGSSSGATATDAGGATGTATDAGKPCIQKMMCTKDKHFDVVACTCVAGAASGAGAGRDGGACVQVQMCITNSHFDMNTCACVKN